MDFKHYAYITSQEKQNTQASRNGCKWSHSRSNDQENKVSQQLGVKPVHKRKERSNSDQDGSEDHQDVMLNLHLAKVKGISYVMLHYVRQMVRPT